MNDEFYLHVDVQQMTALCFPLGCGASESVIHSQSFTRFGKDEVVNTLSS